MMFIRLICSNKVDILRKEINEIQNKIIKIEEIFKMDEKFCNMIEKLNQIESKIKLGEVLSNSDIKFIYTSKKVNDKILKIISNQSKQILNSKSFQNLVNLFHIITIFDCLKNLMINPDSEFEKKQIKSIFSTKELKEFFKSETCRKEMKQLEKKEKENEYKQEESSKIKPKL